MFKAIKEFFFGKPVEPMEQPVAPYKVEIQQPAPAPVVEEVVQKVEPATPVVEVAAPKKEAKPKKAAKPKAEKAVSAAKPAAIKAAPKKAAPKKAPATKSVPAKTTRAKKVKPSVL